MASDQGAREEAIHLVGMLSSLLSWFIVMVAVEVFGGRAHSLASRDVLVWVIPLPIFLLVGYWGGGVRWKALERRYLQGPPS